MKTIYTLFLLSCLAMQACKKDTKMSTETNDLIGKWELTEVYSNSQSAIIPRPANAIGSCTISFINNSSFSGNTFRNLITEGTYTLKNDTALRIGFYYATKINEDDWGRSLNDLFLSCALQSVSPCTPSVIKITGDVLTVKTPFFSTLTFKKVP